MFNPGIGLDTLQSLLRLASAYQTMSTAAGEIIVRRSIKLASGTMSGPDAVSMVMEKPTTFARAAGEAATALASGKDPVGVATAALEPFGTRTAANLQDLRAP